MKHLKLQLLTATAAVIGLAPAAQAQVVLPAATLHGAGATSIQNILVQSMNCIGNPGDHSAGNTDDLNQLGTNNGSLSNVPEGMFTQTSPTAASPDFNCDTQEIQPNFQGEYVATGSGTGRKFWDLFSNQLPGTSPAGTDKNPFADAPFNNVQFAFTDTPVSASDLAAYDANANNATNKAGAPIQIPFYVLPVAIAYNPVYAHYRSATLGLIDLKFRTFYKTYDKNGVELGGMHLNKEDYCKIFNGEITNFNDPELITHNNNQPLRDPNDPNGRWTSVGVPIRLVGRLDNSGTTDIFTRHLAQVCSAYVSTNKFVRNAEALPFDTSSSIDLRGFRSDTRYFPGDTATFAGSIQSLSGAVFVRTAGTVAGHIDTSQGAEAAGLFMVGDGSSAVRDAINYLPDLPAGQTIILNGKIGYIGGDFVKPSPGASLFSASLQVGNTATYTNLTAQHAEQAFGTAILPPQTTASNGAYNVNDPRTGPKRDGTAGTAPIDRANPLHWTSVLYSDPSNTLADPQAGYAITGTTQLVTYTCFATEANRLALSEFVLLNLGKINRDSANHPLAPKLFYSYSSAQEGLLAQLNIAPLPVVWQTVVSQTFFAVSKQVSGGKTLGSRNLWIQNAPPTKQTQVDGDPANGEIVGNPTCTAGKGA